VIDMTGLQFIVARCYVQLADRPLAQAQLEPDIVRYRELELGPAQGELFPEGEEDG
jgi:hypothetical protein